MNMQPKKDCQIWIVLDDVEDDANMVTSLSITPFEQEAIDIHLIEYDEQLDEWEYHLFQGLAITFRAHLDPYLILLWT